MKTIRSIARWWPAGIALTCIPCAAGAAERGAVRHSYTVVLDAPSTGQMLSAERGKRAGKAPAKIAASSTASLRVAVERSQAPVKAAIAASQARVAGAVRNVLNAVFVEATVEQARALGAVPGVARVVRNRRFKLMLNSVSEIVGADEAQQLLGGSDAAGEDVRIAVIDTGIDPDHPAFDDPSLAPPAGFPKGLPRDIAFTNNKIIAARSYVHLLSPQEPASSRPDDPTPRDRVGHGTAVAMIAAGKSVASPVGDLEGVAPKAFLGNYKVFGSPDVNGFTNDNAVLAAIDDAVTDGMDILNIGFGSPAQFPWNEAGPACSDDPAVLCDPVAFAVQSAVLDFGRIVVAPAGNAGAFGEQHFPARNTIAGPATAPDAIAVAATVNARRFTESVRFGGATATAVAGTGPALLQSLSAPGMLASAAGDAAGCAAFPAGSLAGAVVLIERGGCGFEVKVENADAANAAAVVVRNIAGNDEPFLMTGLETTDIPAYMIGAADGAALAELLAASAAAVTYAKEPEGTRRNPKELLAASAAAVTLDPTLRPGSLAWNQVAPFSSRGPSPGLNLKPDIAAPGAFIYSAAQMLDANGDTFHPSGFAQVDGTSFAAPVIAGAAALVWQANPSFTAPEVKSALVNTALQDVVEDGGAARVGSVGGGLVHIPSALEPIATVVPATVSFGWLPDATFPVEREIEVINRGSATHSYTVRIEPRDSDPTGRVRIEGAEQVSFRLNPGFLVPLTVSLSARPAPGSYEGRLRVTRESGGRDLFVPYLYVVGDNAPHNSFALAGTGLVGTADEQSPELLIAKVVDRYGAPTAGLSMDFAAVSGGGAIYAADTQTDIFGVIAAGVNLGPTPGPQEFRATGGGLTVPFFNAARPKPVIAAIVNGAGFAAGRPVAPGSIATIFGEALADYEGSLRGLPLPLALKHAAVTFDFPENNLSVAGRLFFVRDNQLNIQIPWEFAGLNFALVKARIGDSYSETVSIDLADFAPGIIDYPSGGLRFGIVAHAGGSLVTPADPARAGETVVIYMTGNGPVDAAQTTGEAASTANLARTRQLPVVRIAGREAPVVFSGLTPGFVGLYQVNATVPDGLPSGNLETTVTTNGIAGNTVMLPVR